MNDYPAGAYNRRGELWWESTKFGESGIAPRMASWLWWHKNEGDTFTTAEMRRSLNTDAEQFQRRQRDLRDWGWVFDSYQDDPSLAMGQYRLKEKGWWTGSTGPKPASRTIKGSTRRKMLARDGSRCVICGYGAGETYEDGSPVRLTAGHIVPRSHGGSNDLDNLQTECSRCNETARADTGTVIDTDAAWESIKTLNRKEKAELYSWVIRGQRTRSKLDHAYDLYRSCTPAGKEEIAAKLQRYVSKLSDL